MPQENELSVCKHNSCEVLKMSDMGNIIVELYKCRCGKITKVFIKGKEYVDREQVMKTVQKVIHEQVDALIMLTKK